MHSMMVGRVETLFDEITIKKNRDGTYALTMCGYKDPNINDTFDVKIHRLRDFPIVIDRRTEHFQNRHIPRIITADYILKVETRILPNEKGAAIEIRKKKKVRRIQNRNF